jgi:hypothetical protein
VFGGAEDATVHQEEVLAAEGVYAVHLRSGGEGGVAAGDVVGVPANGEGEVVGGLESGREHGCKVGFIGPCLWKD